MENMMTKDELLKKWLEKHPEGITPSVCSCIGPENGEPYCHCQMLWTIRDNEGKLYHITSKMVVQYDVKSDEDVVKEREKELRRQKEFDEFQEELYRTNEIKERRKNDIQFRLQEYKERKRRIQ